MSFLYSNMSSDFPHALDKPTILYMVDKVHLAPASAYCFTYYHSLECSFLATWASLLFLKKQTNKQKTQAWCCLRDFRFLFPLFGILYT